MLTVDTNKLTLSEEDLLLTGLQPGNRCDIEYNAIGPVLVKGEALFTDGKLLTKSRTLSFRGEQNTLLKTVGSKFNLERITTDMFQLITVRDN